ncbi:hypothetical protein [Catellatospora paridis]|nr:hypothetical protein [Catellatospora paridis]
MASTDAPHLALAEEAVRLINATVPRRELLHRLTEGLSVVHRVRSGR